MSKYSGKCDFYDFIATNGAEKVLNQKSVYLGQNIVPLAFKTPSDLVPYYPHIVSIFYGDTIRITTESYIDVQERMTVKDNYNFLIKEMSKLHGNFNEEQIFEKIVRQWIGYWSDVKKEYYISLIRVALKYNCDKNANLNYVHMPVYDMYRGFLYEEMLNNFWPEEDAYKWCYGLERWLKRYLDKVTINMAKELV